MLDCWNHCCCDREVLHHDHHNQGADDFPTDRKTNCEEKFEEKIEENSNRCLFRKSIFESMRIKLVKNLQKALLYFYSTVRSVISERKLKLGVGLCRPKKNSICFFLILITFLTNFFATSAVASLRIPHDLDQRRKVKIDNSRIKLHIYKTVPEHMTMLPAYFEENYESVIKRVRRRTPLLNRHKRLQRLATKAGFYVEIRRKGKVKGTRRASSYTLLEFISVRPGIVAIRGRRSGRFLAMDKKGKLVGLKSYSSSCNFHEIILANNFIVFYQNISKKTKKKRNITKRAYVAFDKKGRPKRGKKVHVNNNAAHFQKLVTRFPSRRVKGKKGRMKKRLKPRRHRRKKKS